MKNPTCETNEISWWETQRSFSVSNLLIANGDQDTEFLISESYWDSWRTMKRNYLEIWSVALWNWRERGHTSCFNNDILTNYAKIKPINLYPCHIIKLIYDLIAKKLNSLLKTFRVKSKAKTFAQSLLMFYSLMFSMTELSKSSYLQCHYNST